MATDYAEKERAFIDGLKENTGRDLAEWMGAIAAQALPHRNDIIDWLRQQGFMFSKASWLERIHHNGGKPIYADSGKGPARSRRADRPPADAQPAAPAAAPPARPPKLTLVASSAPAPSSADLEALLAKAKAYRPLAQHVIARIKAARPGARFEARDSYVAIADPDEFAALGIGAKELRLHLALGEHPPDDLAKKAAPGGGLGKGQALSHMVVLTDARQIDQRLLDLVRLAATKVNG
jgi:Domain of unknown function (DUF5655)